MVSALAWIMYAISENKPRAKLSKLCKKYGLTRVQKSIFLGKLDTSRFDELTEHCQGLIDDETDSVYLFPFCQEDFKRIQVLGQGFDKKLVNDEILSKFF